ncbi:hypothetical protein D0Z00_003435 [Geotrichum galactomycetum]|uniref:Uncharacterized protein n=1 Tax=Geotrichum galactomycetum TaxID=27317 RepID=A0ACB6V1I5_9ASCO|nr:hypothetical protein D0Z00_003435 [Geotrichum candidum]
MYGAGVYYASINSNFHKTFTTYVPLAGTVIDFLEEREYRKNFKTITHKEAEKNSVQLTSAVEKSVGSSSLASEQDEAASGVKVKKVSANSSATSAKSNKDPLSPKRFFNAVSGTVGEEDREYLPLVLLPDDRDEIVNRAAMSLNDLIAGYNAAAITEETVLSVSKTLASVAQSSAAIAPRYAQVIMHKSENFKQLYQGYQLIWDEYLEKQDENQLVANNLKTNPVFADYNHRLAEEINETELLLVKFINAGKRGSDLDMNDAEYVRFKKFKSAAPKKAPLAPLNSNSTKSSSQYIENATATATKYDAAYGGFDGSDTALRVELALTLLVTALQRENTPVVSAYIQGVRDAVATCPDDASRESVINEALKSVSVPKGLDLRPVLHDIIFYDKHF